MNTSRKIYTDTDILIWVGQAYPTINSYIEEARSQGCSRRLPGLFRWIVPGETRVFLVHRGEDNDPAYGSLFGYFTINSLHMVYDDITMSRGPDVYYRPVLKPGVIPPQSREEIDDYIVNKKLAIVREEKIVRRKRKDPETNVFEELIQDWIKDWIKDQIKNTLHRTRGEHNLRHIPWTAEADNIERLCGGVSGLGSGRFPGVYASDEMGDWLLDHILDWLMKEDKLDDGYFWEEKIVGKKLVTQRCKHKKGKVGCSRSGRVCLEKILDDYGEPQADLSGLVVFEKTYPLYYHNPQASFKGIQRLDGDALLMKVGLTNHIRPRHIPPPVLLKKLQNVQPPVLVKDRTKTTNK